MYFITVSSIFPLNTYGFWIVKTGDQKLNKRVYLEHHTDSDYIVILLTDRRTVSNKISQAC